MSLNRRMMIGGAAMRWRRCPSVAAMAKPGDPGRDKVVAAIQADHDATVERLRDWIALPTIANMGINHRRGRRIYAPAGARRRLPEGRIVPTDGVPGVFATLDAGAKDTLGDLFHVRRQAI